MGIILTTPIQTPPKILKMQRIDGIYLDYKYRSISITVGTYENADSEEPEKTETQGFDLDRFIAGEYLSHFKFVFKSIREIALIENMIGVGVDSDD